MSWISSLRSRRSIGMLAAAVCLSAAALVWTGYRAVAEWRRAATLVASRRAESAADLLVAALARDMRGVQALVLASADRDGTLVGSRADLLHPIGSAFARYPYPEAFFSWQESPAPESVVFYTRAERRPPWLSAGDARKLFPVVVGAEPTVARRLIDRVMKDAWQARRFSIFEIDLAGAPYQIITLLTYGDPLREHLVAVLGFMVNLDWARRHYFNDLTAQVNQIEGRDRGVQFMVCDEQNRPVVGAVASRNRDTETRRVFPVAFFDPLVVAIDPPPDLHVPSWSATASAGDDPTLAAAARGARSTLAIAAVMALTLTIGLLISLKAARASANLADMRADFVSAVTHELKTPIANMRAINETLASGRSTLEMSREYAQMGIREANRLTRLVDNLLAYARVTDVADIYAFEPVAIDSVVRRTLQEFGPNLQHGAFDVQIDLPDDLPPVRADASALGLMLNNLVDNAIRYSTNTRQVSLSARRDGARVTVRVTDHGVGIPEHEIEQVTRKFFRGHGSRAGGSGLGLAIVDRIVADHLGTLHIESAPGGGTTVTVSLPAAG